MDPWEGVGTALIAAVVSLAVSMFFRWWEARKVRWIVTGEHHLVGSDDRRATITFHNVGDGDAYGVVTTRFLGGDYADWDHFEAARVASGDSFDVRMEPSDGDFEAASITLTWEASPTARSRKHTHGPLLLHEVLRDTTGLPGTGWRKSEALRLRRPDETD